MGPNFKYFANLILFISVQYAASQNCNNVQNFPSAALKKSSMTSTGFDPRLNGDSLWPDAVVPFTVDNGYSDSDLSKVAEHLNSITTRTCVQFSPTTDCNKPYMQLSSRSYFTMARGMPRSGPARTAGNPDYLHNKPGSMAHALLHVLGFVHEEQRADRQQYLSVGRCGDGGIHRQMPGTYPNALDAFDYSSVMLQVGYDMCTAANATLPPIQQNNAILRAGHSNHGVSDLDVKKINAAYQCK